MGQRGTIVPLNLPDLHGLLAIAPLSSSAKLAGEILVARSPLGLVILRATRWKRSPGTVFNLGFCLCLLTTVITAYHGFADDLALLILVTAVVTDYVPENRASRGNAIALLTLAFALTFTPLQTFLWFWKGEFGLIVVLLFWFWTISRARTSTPRELASKPCTNPNRGAGGETGPGLAPRISGPTPWALPSSSQPEGNTELAGGEPLVNSRTTEDQQNLGETLALVSPRATKGVSVVTTLRPQTDCPSTTGKDPGLIELSVVLPCLNEAETLETCILKAQQTMRDAGIGGEVIVADNGSLDRSIEIGKRLGARVVQVVAKGYGSALMGGIAVAAGKYIVMGDADASYDFGHIPRFLDQLRNGADLVMGNRFRGGIGRNAMPALHQYLGNPALTWIGRLFFQSRTVGDFYCGLRGFRKDAYERMELRTTGMEFATEMVVKATLLNLRITEVPTTLSPDGRSRPPHLRTWRDGWRTLRFFLLYSPRWLFLYPGISLVVMGSLLGLWLLPASRTVGTVTFDVHTLLYAAAFVLLGFQSICFAVFTKLFAVSEKLHPPDPLLDRFFRYITLEVGLAAGAVLTLGGLGASLIAVAGWGMRHFGPLDYSHTMRIVILAVLLLTLGAQTVFASFFLSVLRLPRR